MLYVYVAKVRASLCLQAPDASASTGSSCFSLYRLRLLQPLQAQVVSASTGSSCFSLCRLKLHQPLQAQVASGFCTRGDPVQDQAALVCARSNGFMHCSLPQWHCNTLWGGQLHTMKRWMCWRDNQPQHKNTRDNQPQHKNTWNTNNTAYIGALFMNS